MSRIIAFDFDGVVVDSVSVLKTVYYEFLEQFGEKGSEAEFDSLNGPTIDEIVSTLKAKYKIEEDFKSLLNNYHRLLSEAYSSVPLIEGIVSVLENLANQGIDLALVTSSVRDEVELILRKYKIEKNFKFIITGSDVNKSKPSPEIYLLLKEISNNTDIWAVEDSDNGIKSALGANIKVIYFDQNNTGTSQCVDCRVHDISDIPSTLKGIEKAYCVVEKSSGIKVQVDNSYFPTITQTKNKTIEKIWASAQHSKNLHDERVLFYLGHESKGSEIIIKAFWGSYKYFYCALNYPYLGLNFIPLAVSGICLDKKGFILAAKRKNVSEYANCWEFVPSGGINENASFRDSVDFHTQLLEELFEEASIKAENVIKVGEIGLVLDLSNRVMDICCQIDLDFDLQQSLIENDEYSSFLRTDFSRLEYTKLIPTSLGILNILGKNRIS